MLGSCEDVEGDGEASAASTLLPALALAVAPLLAAAGAAAGVSSSVLAVREGEGWARMREGAFVRTARELVLLPVSADATMVLELVVETDGTSHSSRMPCNSDAVIFPRSYQSYQKCGRKEGVVGEKERRGGNEYTCTRGST